MNDVPRGNAKRSYKAVLISGALAVLGYFLLAAWQSGEQVLQAAHRMTAGTIALVLALSLVNYAIRYWRWHWYLHTLGFPIPIRRGLQYYLAGFSFTTTPGKVGEAVRSVYLKDHNVPYVESLSVFFAERFSDLMAMVFLSCLALWQFPQYQSLVGVALLAIALLLILIQRDSAMAWLRGVLTPPTRRRLRETVEGVFSLLASSATLLKSRALFLGLLMSLVAWGAEGVAFYYILAALDIQVSFWSAIGIYSIAVLIGALSFLPGGLGSTEAVMILLLVLAGAGNAEAITATLICRVATLWFAVLIGGVSLASINRPQAANENA